MVNRFIIFFSKITVSRDHGDVFKLFFLSDQRVKLKKNIQFNIINDKEKLEPVNFFLTYLLEKRLKVFSKKKQQSVDQLFDRSTDHFI